MLGLRHNGESALRARGGAVTNRERLARALADVVMVGGPGNPVVGPTCGAALDGAAELIRSALRFALDEAEAGRFA